MRTPTRIFLIGFFCAASSLFAGFAAQETFLPAVGRVPGQGGAQFYTTVWATNLTTAPVSFTFAFLKQGQDNSSPVSFSDSLSAGETKVYENVIENKFSLTGAIGAARITSTGEILVSERIYDQPAGADVGDTQGLFFAGVPKSFSISLGQSASIQGIDQGGAENFRYNFALVETGGGSPTVDVQLFDASGTILGQKSYVLQPYEQIQPNVADIFSGIATTNARITATVTGGSGSALIAGAQLANESQDSSGFEMSFRDQLLGGGGTAGVTSLNGLTGALTIAHGANTTVNVIGSTITIDAVAGSGTGLTAVAHDNTLAGSGTPGLPLAVAPNLVLTSAVSDVITGNSTATAGSEFGVVGSSTSPSGGGVHGHGGAKNTDGYLGGNDYGVLGVSTDKDGQPVAGNNDFSKTSGVLGYSSAGVLGDATNTGDNGVLGSAENGTGVVGETSSNDPAYSGVAGIGKHNGVLGRVGSSLAPVAAAVEGLGKSVPGVEGYSDVDVGSGGTSTSYYGVFGETESGGVGGVRGDTNSGSGWGVEGNNNVTFGRGFLGGHEYGVLGVAPTAGGASHFYAGDFQGDVIVTGHLNASGIALASFPHATDASKEIRFASPEGPEAGTYFRGSGRIANGLATIAIPESFRMVTSEKGLTVQVTPMGSPAVLYCVKKDLQTIVIQGSSDVEFDYAVNGVRKGSEGFSPVVPNEDFLPRSADDPEFARHFDASAVAALKATGVLNPDGSINLETARRLGWDQRESWKSATKAAHRK